jgi:hypothetical protein
VKTLRTLISILAVVVVVAIGSVVALAAPAAVVSTASSAARADAAEYCPPEEKQRREAAVEAAQGELAAHRAAYKVFLKQQQAARTRYFKTHPKAKDRVAFLRRQQAQQKAMKAQERRLVAALNAAKKSLKNCE